MTNNIAVPIRYDIYLQDLSHDYQDLTLLGHSNTIEEARTNCKLFKEALLTADSRKVGGRNFANCTIIFRPVLKEVRQ